MTTMQQFLAKKYKQIKMNAMLMAGDYSKHQKELINLSIGDHDVITDREVIEKALEDTLKGYTKYTHPLGLEEVRMAIAELNAKQYGKRVELEQIMVTVGACHAMTLALKALINPGDEVVVIAPYFTEYKEQIEAVDGSMQVVYTKEEDAFLPSIQDIRGAVTDQTKAIIINSPCNPSGAILGGEFLRELHKLSQEKGFVILSDEVYTAFTYNDHEFVSMLEIDPNLTHTVILKSLSKDYAMTGWRIGYLLAHATFTPVVRYINEGITYSAPAVSQRAALAAIQDHDRITSKMRTLYEERLNTCYKAIAHIPQLSVLQPRGAIYLFINVKGTGMSGKCFADKLLKEQGVLVLPGNVFGEQYKDYIRIACNKDKSILEEAFGRISKMI